MRPLILLIVCMVCGTSFAAEPVNKQAPVIDDHNLDMHKKESAYVVEKCGQAKGMAKANCVTKLGLPALFPRRGTDWYSSKHYSDMPLVAAYRKHGELKALRDKSRSYYVHMAERVPGELFAEHVAFEMTWIEQKVFNRFAVTEQIKAQRQLEKEIAADLQRKTQAK